MARRALNKLFHRVGAFALVIGFLIAIKAAGLADLNGEIDEIVKCVKDSVAVIGLGTLLMVWRL